MHRYIPRISVVEVESHASGGVVTRQVYSHAFRETEFIAVTAYQNTDVSYAHMLLVVRRTCFFDFALINLLYYFRRVSQVGLTGDKIRGCQDSRGAL
jgi:hypothetical protein